MAKLLVKQVRSKINCPLLKKRGLEALGLRKMGQL
jgi:large subunit ribosomal protein L30